MMKLFNLGEKVVVNKGEARGLAGVIIQNPPTPSHAGWYLVQLNLNAGTLWVESSSMDKVLTVPVKEKQGVATIVGDKAQYRVNLADQGIVGGFGNKTLGQTVIKDDNIKLKRKRKSKSKSFNVGDTVEVVKKDSLYNSFRGEVVEVMGYGCIVHINSRFSGSVDVWFSPTEIKAIEEEVENKGLVKFPPVPPVFDEFDKNA